MSAFAGISAIAEEPRLVLKLDFEGEAWKEHRSEGPRSPQFEDFDPGNLSRKFGSKSSWVERADSEDLRFGIGDTITMECWVKVESINDGAMAYLIGKGRHPRQEGGTGQTQNYAMRLKGSGSGAKLGFLFSSEREGPNSSRDWHRWESTRLVPKQGWHHVAIRYTFGDEESLIAYIDGRATEGTWDMGGATDRAPVETEEALMIGTGHVRGGAETFRGWLDEVRIWRGALSDEILKDRFTFAPPPTQLTEAMVPPGEVLMQISEKGVPVQVGWPEYPIVTETYRERAFGIFELPHRYVGTGVRGDRANPTHLRLAAHVVFPEGTHRLLLRGRGGARLSIDGDAVLETPFPGRDTGGHGKLSKQDEYLDLGPDFRFAPPGNREKWVEWSTKGGEHFVVLETMVGGPAGRNLRRPELGETVVAWSPEGSESWQLVSPRGEVIPYTDEGWSDYRAEREAALAETNALNRELCRQRNASFWNRRRSAAEQWLRETDAVAVPDLPSGYPSQNPIDHFIGHRIAQAAAESDGGSVGTVDYFDEIQPLLEKKCYDCHQGSETKGELRLDRRSDAFAGGELDGPGIVSGEPLDSSLIFRVGHEAGIDIMPPKGDPLSDDEIALLTRWIEEGAVWPSYDVEDFEPMPLSDDRTFLRRLALDTVGVPPSEDEIARFLADPSIERRNHAIDRYLDDPRWADRWMGYWQDILAENPNIINPTLNNTGPFRWWIYESLLDNKPLDLMVTELVRLEGSERFGGPAGFATASNNDVPMAAKGIILSSAFMGVEMKCARCHDAPAHASKQEDLFALAAMLNREPLTVPKTSSVPMDQLHQGGRQPLIEVTLKPGSKVAPGWPFSDQVSPEVSMDLAENPEDPRERLAALLTAPQNTRFAEVMVNRIWSRLMGRGLVETVGDWERADPSHPDLLAWLARELVASGYDMKAIARLILRSHTWQRATDSRLTETSPLFISPSPRRLEAEQIVDSLFSATGAPFDLEEVSLDIDSVRVMSNSITLGVPRRSWMLASTSNERDRPSLSLPRIQAVSSILETFGWRSSRQDPTSEREVEANVLQPAILANGTMGVWLTRLSDRHAVTELAMEDQSVERLIERLYARLLTREPSVSELDRYVAWLTPGYERRIQEVTAKPTQRREPVRYVSWSNHLDGAANTLAQEKEAEARAGDPPTDRLDPEWRLRLEDLLWALLNSPEWIYSP